jgi:hypothetical protein
MDDGKRFYERPVFWPRLIGGILLFIFVIAFRSEILLLLRMLLAIIHLLSSQPAINLPPETPRAVLALLVNLFIYLGVFFLILKWVSLFVLPAHDSREKQKVNERLVEYVFGLHGPAVFVKNGELIARKDEEVMKEGDKARFASLAFVDLASAIVLESRSLTPVINVPKEADPKKEQSAPIRALGPGIAFLTPRERIRGCADLRMQTRTIKEVHGFTSDGIELNANVNINFTLGQPPEVMTVFDTKKHGLHVLKIDRDTKKISISEKIDEGDAAEIQENLHTQKPSRNAEPALGRLTSNRPPYRFEEEHVISAVISQPRNTKDGKLEKWTDLPARVAVSVLLDELSRVSYDDLYSLDSPDPVYYLFDTFKPEFIRKVKEMGVLSYQFVQRKDGGMPQKDDHFNSDEYVFWDVVELHNPKPIRDRGIKVIEVNFSDFIPTDKTIQDQHFENWRARWQKKAELTIAEYDLEVMRNMNHARAQAQREIIYNLSQIFKLPGYTQDAMAIRIFQALESAAANPATNRLLPRDTVDMLRNFQRLLFTPSRDGQPPEDLPSEGGSQDL